MAFKKDEPAKEPAKRLDVYTVTERQGQSKGWWTKIGSAWVNKDGSLNVKLDALPLNGSLNIREPKPREE